MVHRRDVSSEAWTFFRAPTSIYQYIYHGTNINRLAFLAFFVCGCATLWVKLFFAAIFFGTSCCNSVRLLLCHSLVYVGWLGGKCPLCSLRILLRSLRPSCRVTKPSQNTKDISTALRKEA